MLDLFYTSLATFQAACVAAEVSDTELFVSGEYFMSKDGEVMASEYYGNTSPFITL